MSPMEASGQKQNKMLKGPGYNLGAAVCEELGEVGSTHGIRIK